MKTFNIEAIRYGFITIEAETEEEALEIAEEIGTDEFEWTDVEIADCQEED